jgi:uncharacterized membrane protein YbaN (DUF454 family)
LLNERKPVNTPIKESSPDHPADAAAEPDSSAQQAQVWRHLRLRTVLWRVVALVFTALGVIGLVLPVMPHVPFFLVALWAAGKGWPALERRLLEHPQIGPQLRNWKDNRAISMPVKCVTTAMMVASAIGMQLFGDLPMWLRVGAPCFMLIGIVFIWTRPSA